MDVAVLVEPARADPARRDDSAQPPAEDPGALDRSALEAARALAARHGATVHLVTASPHGDDAPLRRSLETVGHEATLVADDRLAGADPWGLAHALEAAVRETCAPDLVLAGLTGPNRGSGQTGPRVAELLETALATRVTRLSLSPGEDAFEATRIGDATRQRLQGPLPATVTVHPDYEPRLDTVRDRLAARDADATQAERAEAADAVRTLTVDDLDVHENLVGRAGSPTRVLEAHAPETTEGGEPTVHEELTDEAVDRAAAALARRGETA